MQMDIDHKKFEGDLKAMANAMVHLSWGVQDHLYGTMTLAAAKVVAKRGKGTSAFNDRTGQLRKSIRGIAKDIKIGGKRIKRAAASTVIGGRKGARQGHLIELGTADRFTSRGRYTGRIDPRPVLQVALNSAGDQAFSAAVAAGRKEFGKLIDAARGFGKLNRSQIRALER